MRYALVLGAALVAACGGSRADSAAQASAVGGREGCGGARAADANACTRAWAAAAPVGLYDGLLADLARKKRSVAARTAAVEAFLRDVDAQGGTPLEEPSGDRVVFVAKG